MGDLPKPWGPDRDRLVHAGLLDPYYVDQAAQAQREAPPGTGIAALLVDRGLISADAARVFLQEQMIDSLTDLLGWRTGSFELSDSPPPVVRLAVAVSTEALLTEVRRRLAEQERVRTVVTTVELVPSVTANRPDNLPLDESVVLREIDGSRTVHQLATDLGFGDNELRRIVYGLTLMDAVTLDGGVVVTRDEDPLDDIEYAIEDSLDEALAGHVSEEASDELSSLLENLLHTAEPEPDPLAEDEAEAKAEAEAIDEAITVDEESAEAMSTATDTVVDDEPVADEPADHEPAAVDPPLDEPATPDVGALDVPADDDADQPTQAVSRIESGRFDDTDIDEPGPWIGYATAKPGTTPPQQRPPSPAPVPAGGDLPYLAPAPTEPARDGSAETDETDQVDEVDEVGGVDELFPGETPAEQAPKRATGSAAGNDDLSALLAELSSLSNEEEPADRPDAPPPRKPSSGPEDRDSKDPKKRRLFGR